MRWLFDPEQDPNEEAPPAPAPAPQAPPMDPKVRQYMMEKYFAKGGPGDNSGVQDARQAQNLMNLGAGVGEALGNAGMDRSVQTFKKGWNETGAPQTTKSVAPDVNLGEVRQAGGQIAQRAYEDRAKAQQDFWAGNKLETQGIEDAQRNRNNAWEDEQRGQQRKQWDVQNRAASPDSPAAQSARLIYQNTLLTKAREAEQAGMPDVAKSLRDSISTAGQNMSASDILAQENAVKNLDATAALKVMTMKEDRVANREYRQGLQEDRNRGKQDKAEQDATKAALTARGNPAVQQAGKDIYAADKALKMVEGKDPNTLTTQDLRLLSEELGKIATGGVPGEHGVEALMPNNLQTKIAEMKNFLSSNPTDANAAAYIAHNMEYLKGMRDVAQQNLDAYQTRAITPYRSQMGEEAWARVNQNLGIGQPKQQSPNSTNAAPGQPSFKKAASFKDLP